MAIVRLRPEDLRRAIAENALSLQFQPQVYVPTGKLVGAEAFVRWPHPSYGMIGPSDIIPLVELGRFHVEFDRWVITALCEQIKRWDTEGFDVPIVAANLWSQTLRSPDVVEMVSRIVIASDVRADAVEIEMPNGTLRNPALAEAARRLRLLGVRVATEEFTDRALASAASDFDTLKIGYPIVRELGVAGSDSPAAVSAVVDAARAAGARVVADSVELEEQEEALLALGCEVVQGYLYGPEVSAAELKTLAAVGVRPTAE
jgi:EAL domain-containing protein (putative c-di-GMP-specific phosphodiesterase class I)